GQVVVVDRWYPSSKTCSCCGYRMDVLPLTVRHWRCPGCDALHDRDVNAAINLRNMAVTSTASACGGAGTGLARQVRGETGPGEAGIQQQS
ncbi:transposase, partial [Massilia aurea]